jgi:hypothetical protein
MAKADYDQSIKVKQDVIDRIKKMGMKGSLDAAAGGGESAEFREGVKRMYGGNRLGQARDVKMTEADNAAYKGNEGKSVPMPASAPAAATRRSAPPGLSPANMQGINKATTAASNTAANIQSKLGGSPNAGTASANFITKSVPGGVRSIYRRLTHTEGGAKHSGRK